MGIEVFRPSVYEDDATTRLKFLPFALTLVPLICIKSQMRLFFSKGGDVKPLNLHAWMALFFWGTLSSGAFAYCNSTVDCDFCNLPYEVCRPDSLGFLYCCGEGNNPDVHAARWMGEHVRTLEDRTPSAGRGKCGLYFGSTIPGVGKDS